MRVDLAGPGKAFGYESLIDDLSSPVTAITRERTLLLVLPREPFKQLYGRDDTIARALFDVLLRDRCNAADDNAARMNGGAASSRSAANRLIH